MANVIKVKRGTSTPTTSNLANIGEFAFDYSANKLYIRSSSQVVCGFLICQELFFKRLKENDSENYYSNIKECIL